MKKFLLFMITVLTINTVPGAAVWADEKEARIITAEQFIERLQYIDDTTTRYAVSNDINIRMEPNTNCGVYRHTGYNEKFEVLLELGGWSMVSKEGMTAFIKSEYLSKEETAVYMGRFKISHYCCEKYKHICGTGSGKTATGLDVRPGLISVDPRLIPLGSVVIINGKEYRAEDTGGMIKGKKIDMAVAHHQEALDLGVYYADVYVKKR
ncbi:MAG: 3D domain-containing protein [Clostridiaceae bacterium]|nr:3D domain-containing protein [Clostridiaceae bacterium]